MDTEISQLLLKQAPENRVYPEMHSVQLAALLQRWQLVMAPEQLVHFCPLTKNPSKQASQRTVPAWREQVKQFDMTT